MTGTIFNFPLIGKKGLVIPKRTMLKRKLPTGLLGNNGGKFAIEFNHVPDVGLNSYYQDYHVDIANSEADEPKNKFYFGYCSEDFNGKRGEFLGLSSNGIGAWVYPNSTYNYSYVYSSIDLCYIKDGVSLYTFAWWTDYPSLNPIESRADNRCGNILAHFGYKTGNNRTMVSFVQNNQNTENARFGRLGIYPAQDEFLGYNLYNRFEKSSLDLAENTGTYTATPTYYNEISELTHVCLYSPLNTHRLVLFNLTLGN